MSTWPRTMRSDRVAVLPGSPACPHCGLAALGHLALAQAFVAVASGHHFLLDQSLYSLLQAAH